MKKKVILSVLIIPLIFLVFYLAKCYEYSEAVSFYPVIQIKTVAPEKTNLFTSQINGRIFHYSVAEKKQGIYELTDNGEKLIFEVRNVLSVTSADDILACLTENSIYFYNFSTQKLNKMTGENINEILKFISQDCFRSDNILSCDKNRIMLSFCFDNSRKRTKICIYPEIDVKNSLEEVEEFEYKKLVDNFAVNDADTKQYGDNIVYIKTNELRGNLSINDIMNELHINNLTDGVDSCIYKTSDKQQIIYADNEKYIILDYNEKAYFLRYVGAEESVFLKNCNLKHFDSYTFERPGDDTILILDNYYRIVDRLNLNQQSAD